MGQDTWSVEIAEIVNATPERVMSWWFDPDRWNDVPGRLEKLGAIDISQTASTIDGLRFRAVEWKDRNGWAFHQDMESRPDPSGMAPRIGDRFSASASGSLSFRHPRVLRGKKLGFSCVERTEFVPQADGSTQVVLIHNHTTKGGRLQRRHVRVNDRTRELAEAQIAQCRAAVNP